MNRVIRLRVTVRSTSVGYSYTRHIFFSNFTSECSYCSVAYVFLYDSMDTSVPSDPDPKENGAIFLGWLKKRGGLRGAVDCERKCKENGFEAKRFIKDMGEMRIALYLSRGNKVILLKDKV